MKKSTKIIISIAIVITILIIGVLAVYAILNVELHHLTIADIETDRVICESSYIAQKRHSREQNIITEEELQEIIQSKWGYYYFLTENVLFIDSNWHIADVSKLKVGDYIQVININPMKTIELAGGFPRKIENIKYIRVLKNNND